MKKDAAKEARERVRLEQQERRASQAQPHQLAEDWKRLARRFATEHSLPLPEVLDTFDMTASLHLYSGDDWATAQAKGWAEVVALLKPRGEARDAA